MYHVDSRIYTAKSVIGPIPCHRCRTMITQFKTAEVYNIYLEYQGLASLCVSCHEAILNAQQAHSNSLI